MSQEQFLSTLDLIHAAAFDTRAWESVLRRLAELTGCVAGGLTLETPATRRGTPITYFGFDATHVARTFDHYLPMNPLFGIAPRMQPGFIVANADVIRPDTFRKSEFYNGWARPQGLCSPVTLVTHRRGGRYIPLTLVKPDGGGEATPVDRALLARFAPHLMHAMDVTLRLQASEAQHGVLSRALDCLSEGAVLIDCLQRVVFMNGAARAMLDRPNGSGLRLSDGELAARDPESDRALQASLAQALGKGGPSRGSEITVKQGGVAGKISLAVSPLPGRGPWEQSADTDGGAGACCLVLINDGGLASLARNFRLTPAETRLVEAVMIGKGLAWAARSLGISRSTAQSHLDSVFQKTGTNRQAELVALAHSGRRFS